MGDISTSSSAPLRHQRLSIALGPPGLAGTGPEYSYSRWSASHPSAVITFPVSHQANAAVSTIAEEDLEVTGANCTTSKSTTAGSSGCKAYDGGGAGGARSRAKAGAGSAATGQAGAMLGVPRELLYFASPIDVPEDVSDSDVGAGWAARGWVG